MNPLIEQIVRDQAKTTILELYRYCHNNARPNIEMSKVDSSIGVLADHLVEALERAVADVDEAHAFLPVDLAMAGHYGYDLTGAEAGDGGGFDQDDHPHDQAGLVSGMRDLRKRLYPGPGAGAGEDPQAENNGPQLSPIGKRIKAAIDASKITKPQLALRAKVAAGTIDNILAGSQPRQATMQRLDLVLDEVAT